MEAGEEGYLYHWMNMKKTEDVFENDYMPARWEHEVGGRRIFGNSFSRNKMFSFGEERCVRLTVDKRILASTNKIIPLDAELVHTQTHFPQMKPPRDRLKFGRYGSEFAEEFVIGDIRNIARCIVKVDVRRYYSGSFYSFVQHTVKQFCHTHDIDYELSPEVQKYLRDTEERWAEDDLEDEAA